ncbi:MAG: hypothetical protein K0U70_12470, partial [Actinomycetia bacterium]|nr:hypothetical protein [Actinomycetes bacterium]
SVDEASAAEEEPASDEALVAESDDCDGAPPERESDDSAELIAGLVATPATPNATANAPAPPTYLTYLMAAPQVDQRRAESLHVT